MKQTFNSICKQATEAKERLKQAILSLPDAAGGVKMLGKGCCSVPLSLINKHGGNMSPSFWLTKETKAELLRMLDSNRSLDNLVKNVEDVLTYGRTKDGAWIPQNVQAALRAAWEG